MRRLLRRRLAVLGAVISLLVIGLFGRPNTLIGVAVDLAALLGMRRSSPSLLGA